MRPANSPVCCNWLMNRTVVLLKALPVGLRTAWLISRALTPRQKPYLQARGPGGSRRIFDAAPSKMMLRPASSSV